MDTMTWQPSLLDATDERAEPDFAPDFPGAQRRELAGGAWIELVPGWCRQHDALFERVLHAGGWQQQDLAMWGERVAEPRLAAHWGTRELPVGLGVLHDAVEQLSRRYRAPLDQITANLYRDGSDSVAWHGDRELRDRDRAVVAVLTLGTARAFHLRPRGGGASIRLRPMPGDLIVMGGSCQRTWQHAVPKTARPVGPRACVMFRHDPEHPPALDRVQIDPDVLATL
jgi:alkylated DNA repair dioxygenase AlkB